ncbi:hypothetical protein BTO30_13700 [Domibacillus antri]|uniref:LemA family protein n=1 Tax=Domibacillus antri TaxID=1714264 RepID=A0A1Q8Q2V9_9BACI|nr:LemA family protein [Domibacillus antri]OLN21669.1 hypothetical protein BTO30_13700 [Domibacillus antri]
MENGLWIIFTGAGLTLLLFVWTYRRLIGLQKKTEALFRDVDRFMEARVNLYAKWAETVAAYDLNEQGILAEMMIIRDRFPEMTAEEKLRLCGKLDLFYERMTASAAKCPPLRTSPMYIQLHARVDDMMEEMPDACSHYNAHAGQLNEAISRFPANMTAVLFGFEKKELFIRPKKNQKLSDFFFGHLSGT